MLKQNLQQKLLQKLSPQQIQLIKLLEVPTLQLEQRIKKEIEENPVLEEGPEEEKELPQQEEEDPANEDEENIDDFSLDDYLNDEEMPAYKLNSQNYSKDDDDNKEIPFSTGKSFHEHLESQLGLYQLSEKEYTLGTYLIGGIDENGYIRRSLETLADDIVLSLNIDTSVEELKKLLSIIQSFDPPGVGARDLQECLLIQINRKIAEGHNSNILLLAQSILKHYFKEFSKKHYKKIAEKLNISDEELKAAMDEILKLNPKPGSNFGGADSNMQQIIPDFILELNNNELNLRLNSQNSPDLRINQTYREMLKEYNQNKNQKTKTEKEAMMFVKQKLEAAKWFIDAIKQRQNTLMVTMNAIIEYQREYFLEGDERKLRPMILKDIAERTGLDISTISRVVNSKYIQTPFGIFSLKYFFSEGMQTEDGEEVSTREIKSILNESIENEDKKKPLTDEKLSRILKDKGYKIARRTVAKYREQLNIPVARLRKKI